MTDAGWSPQVAIVTTAGSEAIAEPCEIRGPDHGTNIAINRRRRMCT